MAKRKPSPYNLFVKKHWNTVTGAAPERIKKIAKKWRGNKS